MKVSKSVYIAGISLFILMTFFCTPCFSVNANKVYNVTAVTYRHLNGQSPAIDEEYPDGTPISFPILSNLCQGKGIIDPLDNVFGFKASLNGNTVVLTWDTVTRYNNAQLQAAGFLKYVLYRASSSGWGYQFFTELDSVTLTCSDTSPLPDSYYRIVAVDDIDNTGGYSVIVDNSGNVYSHRADVDVSGDSVTRLIIPSAVAGVLYAGGDYDRHIEVTRNTDEEGSIQSIGDINGTITASFSFDSYRWKGRVKETSLEFPSNVQMVLRYEIENGFVKNTGITVSNVKDRLGFYYFNGLKWIKVPATLNEADQTLTAAVNHLSKYALIAGLANATKLALVERYPAVFTPNGDGVNDIVFIRYDKSTVGQQVTGKIFDLSGSLVRQVSEISPGEMRWDGKDTLGDVMESGIYIYQVQAGTEMINGTLILAK